MRLFVIELYISDDGSDVTMLLQVLKLAVLISTITDDL